MSESSHAPAALAAYYARRAQEYERIYAKPERQVDLARLRLRLSDLLAGRRVLELACGTGYWTAVIAPAAASVHALDINEEVLAIARAKPLPPGRVVFVQGDAFLLDGAPAGCDAALAAFWWSHVERRRLPAFLATLHARLAPGARVVFLDNRYVEGSSTPISRRDADGNMYQIRHLDRGAPCEVLKNFPTAEELTAQIEPFASAARIETLAYYWILVYTLR